MQGHHPPGKRQHRSHARAIGALVAVFVAVCSSAPASAQLRGHGGPVRALSIAPDGRTLLSGSFDGSAIRWSLLRDSAEQVLRFHAGAVNATAILRDGRAVTAGADGRIAIWTPGQQQPDTVLEGHTAPIAALAVSPDGMTLASAAWDHTVRLWPLKGGAPRLLEGHTQNVNGLAFSVDGEALISASYDLTLRIWPVGNDTAPAIISLPAPLNAVITSGGGIATAGADGKVYFLTATGVPDGELATATAPIIALAMSGDGAWLAAADIRGAVAIIDMATRRVARRLVGPGLPVWSVAFMPDNATLLTGGADGMIRRWNALNGEPVGAAIQQGPGDPLAAYAGDRGAEIFRACVACHTLTPDQGNKAGPTLAGIFGRRIATLPGYNFSEPLKRLDIVWTPETVSKLFEVGPAAYTPGTKMPEQTIGSDADRAALVQFLARATQR